jgi:hypothetical protein
METKIKKLNLRPFKLTYAPNGYALSLVLKRLLTFREANHIASKILGIPTELTFDDLSDDKEALLESKKQLVNDIQNLITGETGFDSISDSWANGDALEDLYPSIFFAMLKYLLDKDIIQ